MATNEQDVIEEAQSSDSPEPRPKPKAEVSPLNSWLEYVNRKYVAGVTLSFMKFSFRAEIPVRLLESASSLLELFVHIKNLYNGDEVSALSRLVYTLNLMGHKRFGRKAVRQLKTYNISEPPKHDPSKDSRRAQLYQCLAEIGCRLTDHEEYQIRRFCAKEMDVNWLAMSMNSMVSLMALLIQEQRITEENQSDLAYALTTIGADHCIDYIIEYRKRNGLPTQSYSDMKNPDFKSTATSKTYSSNRSVQTGSSRGTPTSFAYVTADEQEGPPPPVRGFRSRPHVVSPLMNTFLDDTLREHPTEGQTDSDESADEHTPLVAHRPGPFVRRCTWILLASLTVFALLIVVGVAGSAYGTIHAVTHQYSSDRQLVFGPSIVPLVDHLLPYYLSDVGVAQEPAENTHDIDLYLVQSPCDQLNSTNTTNQTTAMNSPHIENITGWYLLPGSEIEYFVCAVTNVSHIDYEVIVEAYLVDNLNAVWSLVHDHNRDIQGVEISKELACNDGAPCLCWAVSYRVERAGYYSVLFTLNNPVHWSSMRYNYTRTVTTLTHSLPSPEHVLHHCSLPYADLEKTCTFLFNDSSTHLPWNMNKEVCLLADVHELNVPPDVRTVEKEFSRVNLVFSQYSTNWLLVSGAVLAALVVVLAVVVTVEIIVCVRAYKAHPVAP